MKIIRIRLLLIILYLPLLLFSQDDNLSQDFQIWNDLEFKHKGYKNLDFIFKGGIRLEEHSGIILKYFSDLSIKRKHNNIFSYSVGYRYLFDKNTDLVFDKKHRFYGDIRVKKTIYKRFLISTRTRLQTQVDYKFTFSEDVKNKLREKIKLTYSFKTLDLEFFSAVEPFYLFGDGFEKIRYIVGLEKSLLETVDINLCYMYQKELNNPLESFSVFKTGFSYRIR